MADNKKTHRVQHKFWLDTERENEAWLHVQVMSLKQKRSFVTTVRQAIELILDLRAGRLDVLVDLFPWVKDHLRSGSDDDLKQQIADLKRTIMEQGSNRIDENAPIVAAPPRKLSGMQSMSSLRPVAKPIDDNDEDTKIVVKKSTSTESGLNFLASMSALN